MSGTANVVLLFKFGFGALMILLLFTVTVLKVLAAFE